MRQLKFNNDDKGREEWLNSRLGRISGTRVKDVITKRSNTPKKGFYELIAERIAIPASDENRMDRGLRLEDEAIARFSSETGKKVCVDLVLWYREDNENIACSPDGVIGEDEAVEVKCLNTASHIEAYITKDVPKEYEDQITQYFVVNDKLETLYMVFYDPRCPKDFFYFEIKRSNVQEKVADYLVQETDALNRIEEIIKEMVF